MSIEERLARLEKGTRFWKRLALVLLAALGAVVLMGQARGRFYEDIEVRSVSLKDTNGRLRGHFGIDADGLASLRLLHSDGRTQGVFLSLNQGGGILSFDDKNSAPRARLQTIQVAGQEEWQGHLSLWGASGAYETHLTATNSFVRLVCQKEGNTFLLAGGSGNISAIRLRRQGSKGEVALGTNSESGDGHIHVLDSDGKPIFATMK